MFDKEKGQHTCHTNPETGEMECGCETDEQSLNTITLEMEDGTEKEFVVIDTLEYEGKSYVALCEGDSAEYDILSFDESEEGLELSYIEDDKEYAAVAQAFDELWAEEEDEEVEEEESK